MEYTEMDCYIFLYNKKGALAASFWACSISLMADTLSVSSTK